jgi:hypothetical protein
MATGRSWFEIALMILGAAALLVVLGRGLKAAERRGWIRLHGTPKATMGMAFAAVEDIFAASRTEPRQMLEAQRRFGHRAPAQGDGLDDGPEFTGGFGGKLTVERQAPRTTSTTTATPMPTITR